ncbi:MAG: hypothetical protein ACJAUP_003761 [Cellvibrionaceae bacterium]|jgi:hypothetical protein
MAKHNVIAIDLAKTIFQVCGMTNQQKTTFNKSISRKNHLNLWLNNHPAKWLRRHVIPAIIGLDALKQ